MSKSDSLTMKLTQIQCLLLATSSLAVVASAVPQPARLQEESTEQPQKVLVTDEPVDSYRLELLNLAFGAASEFPTVPHIKNRCRAQYEVVEACFELGQPLKALGYSEHVDDWRKGAGLADFAAYCAQRGEKSERVLESVKRARAIADKPAGSQGDDQAWRRDRVLAKVAFAEYLLGEESVQGELMDAALTSGSAQVALLMASMSTQELLDSEFEMLASSLERNDFEHTRGLLGVLVDLYDRDFEQELTRHAVEAKIRTSWGKLPLMIRMDLLMGMAAAAARHSDSAEFERFRKEAFELFESFTWMPEDQVALEAKWAGLRFQLGDEAAARIELAAATERFDKEHERIYDINRAEALRPIAEAYWSFGDVDASKAMYLRTLAAGVENPNSRPRADDFITTCCSMALHSFEPDEEVWKRLREIKQGLGKPW